MCRICDIEHENNPDREHFMYRELLLGCGSRRIKDLWIGDLPFFPGSEWAKPEYKEFQNVMTLDINSEHKPDIIFDLSMLGLCPYILHPVNDKIVAFDESTFDEIHAYEILEHIGAQGDYRCFFAQFEEFWRILKPGGFFFATCPAWHSIWAWGDPGHTRVISDASLVFLDQEQYKKQIGKTSMTDYRFCYRGDFETVMQRYVGDVGESFQFILRARK